MSTCCLPTTRPRLRRSCIYLLTKQQILKSTVKGSLRYISNSLTVQFLLSYMTRLVPLSAFNHQISYLLRRITRLSITIHQQSLSKRLIVHPDQPSKILPLSTSVRATAKLGQPQPSWGRSSAFRGGPATWLVCLISDVWQASEYAVIKVTMPYMKIIEEEQEQKRQLRREEAKKLEREWQLVDQQAIDRRKRRQARAQQEKIHPQGVRQRYVASQESSQQQMDKPEIEQAEGTGRKSDR